MKEPPVSHDPHFLNWPRKPNDPQNLNNNCFSYAVGNRATITQFADRNHPGICQPEPGDAIGMPAKIFTLAHGFNAGSICKLAAMMQMTQVQVADYEKIPEAPEGQRLVVMWFLPAVGGARTAMYHWAKQDPRNPEHPNRPRVFTGKMADDPPNSKDSFGNVIVDPRYAKFRTGQEGPFFFFIPEEGLDLRMHRDWVEPVKQAYDLQGQLRVGKPVPEIADVFSNMAALVTRGTDPKVDRLLHTVIHQNRASVALR